VTDAALPPQPANDDYFMREALAEARLAADKGEVPIGCVIVKDGEIVGRGHNLREASQDPTAHAEMIAIRDAASRLGAWRLTGCALYVTVEPCPMCAGAIVLARIDRLVYALPDEKAGAVRTLYGICSDPRLNHRVSDIVEGVLADEARALIQDFFRRLRQQPGS
jgi:tRNA(adenine34) deaminase